MFSVVIKYFCLLPFSLTPSLLSSFLLCLSLFFLFSQLKGWECKQKQMRRALKLAWVVTVRIRTQTSCPENLHWACTQEHGRDVLCCSCYSNGLSKAAGLPSGECVPPRSTHHHYTSSLRLQKEGVSGTADAQRVPRHAGSVCPGPIMCTWAFSFAASGFLPTSTLLQSFWAR